VRDVSAAALLQLFLALVFFSSFSSPWNRIVGFGVGPRGQGCWECTSITSAIKLKFSSVQCECCVEIEADDDRTKADKKAAQQLVIELVMPLNQQWLHSFSPGTVDAGTGNNVLHEMCSFLLMSDQEDWDYQLAEWFIDRGISVHTQNKSGRTPLLQYAATALPQIHSAAAMRLLLEHGADLNAQGRDGNGVLHYLIQSDAVKLLEDFCTSDEVSRLDCFISNSSRQNPFDLVADRLEKDPTDEQAQDMHRVLKGAQTALWDQHTRPVLQLHLGQVLPVRDLAELALSFIGGSSRPSDCVAMQTDDDHPAASAAAARS